MARIRSIHPTTQTDPDLASISVEGRLLFIYSWTIADDAGNLERNPLGLKMALFPADEWATPKRITELVEALIAGRFYEPYEAGGKQYLQIRNFAKYQKPDHPTAPRYPLFPGQEFTYHVRQGNTWVPKTVESSPPDRSVNVPRALPETTGSVLTGEELDRKGKDLDRREKEGRGPGREGNNALPSPPLGRGGAAADRNPCDASPHPNRTNNKGPVGGEEDPNDTPESRRAYVQNLAAKVGLGPGKPKSPTEPGNGSGYVNLQDPEQARIFQVVKDAGVPIGEKITIPQLQILYSRIRGDA